MSKFEWVPGSRAPEGIDADSVGRALEKIGRQNDGVIKPFAVVEAARPEKSPLHDCFEWDDNKAAEQFRIEQARGLIRSIRVIVKVSNAETVPVRAFLHVKETECGGGYVEIRTVMRTPAFQQQVLESALSELKAWQARYRQLSELVTVFTAIEAFESQFKEAA